MSAASTPLTVRVAHKRTEADGICSLELHAQGDAPLPAFTAGAHIDVHLPNGLVRQYSLCNDPAETHRYLIAVLRDPASRGGSQAVHDQVHPGMTLSISPPRNHFPLAESAPHHVLLAGGIGITPLLSMAQRLEHIGASFELHHCARDAARTPFQSHLSQLGLGSRCQLHLDDRDGPLDLVALLRNAPPLAHLYVCGPQGFMEAVLSTARAQGWAEERLHREFFGATTPQAATSAAFELELGRGGRVIQVAAQQSALQALLAAGVDIPMSCEQGVCGTCLTRVLDGQPDHRDHYLTPEEQAANDQFLPCCSRSQSPRLVLDL
jgi:vanillate O-demethylase ferredoxin subunit